MLPTQRAGISFKAPEKEIKFILNDVVKAPAYYGKLGFENADEEVINGLIDACASFCENDLAPLYEVGDREGCTLHKDGTVTTPTGFKEAFHEYAAGGWQGLSVPEEYGGQNLPQSLGLIKAELIASANWSWGMYPGLSIGAMNTLILHGSEEQKQTYLTKLADGTWTGTMCLTEPQCGTDLGQVKTKAEANEDGSYSLTGTKIFISCGDHDFTENIVHIVLARLPNAPEGTKGISLFVVPKHVVKSDGSLEENRNVETSSLENKMGIHGSSTCVLTFENSVGYLIGEPHRGLHQMFTFMNTARLGTALQGISAMEISLQTASAYAKERLSMRSLSGPKHPDKVADPIIVQPDVRRMLLTIKAILEGSRVMMYEGALLADKMLLAETEADRKKFDDELGLFTPILKGFLTELGLECASHGLQCFGGHGYIKDHPMEQILRDTRIATLYEGTTGIQALDLLGRKVLMNKGKLLRQYTKSVFDYIRNEVDYNGSAPLIKYVYQVSKHTINWNTKAITLMLKASKDREIVGAGAYDFMMFGGYTQLAFSWLKICNVACKKMKEDPENADFYKAKLQTAEFFFNRILPRAQSHASIMTQDASDILALDEKFL